MKDFIKNFFGRKEEDNYIPVGCDIENAIRKSITVSGRVQGVGFRFFTQGEANKLRLTGWVKNLNNGNVTMEVQGAAEDIEELINRLKKGNGFSKVTDIEIKDLTVDREENKFAIAY